MPKLLAGAEAVIKFRLRLLALAPVPGQTQEAILIFISQDSSMYMNKIFIAKITNLRNVYFSIKKVTSQFFVPIIGAGSQS